MRRCGRPEGRPWGTADADSADKDLVVGGYLLTSDARTGGHAHASASKDFDSGG